MSNSATDVLQELRALRDATNDQEVARICRRAADRIEQLENNAYRVRLLAEVVVDQTKKVQI